MGWTEKHLGQEGRERVAHALEAAHAATDGKIVAVLARRSARHGHCFWLAAALCLCVLQSGLSASGTGFLRAHGPLVSAALALLALGLGWLLSRPSAVRRLLTPRKDRIEAVHRAAEASYHRLGLHREADEAGVLLYVSLEERRAVVLAGAGIHAPAGDEHWGKTCRSLTQAAAKGSLGAGFEEAIAHAAKALTEHYPRRKKSGRKEPGRLHILHEPF